MLFGTENLLKRKQVLFVLIFFANFTDLKHDFVISVLQKLVCNPFWKFKNNPPKN